MAKYRKKWAEVEAKQFKVNEPPWPNGFKPWPDINGFTARDMSWGYVDTPEGRKHVQESDWIITDGDGKKYLRDDRTFQRTYEEIA